MNVGMILAGGRGDRFGGEIPKQYTEVLGKPVLAYTMEVFERSSAIDAIQVVCQPEYSGHVAEMARKYGIDKLRWITPGGENCPASIRNGINDLRCALRDDDNLIMHMGVSPLVSPEDIASVLEVCRERGCCFTMHPVYVCMARRGGADWAETDAPKEDYVELNVPWAFRYGEVYGLYNKLETAGHVLSERDYTLGLWLADGRRAWYTPGSEAGRMKITTLHDRDLFEGYLLLQRQRNVQDDNGGWNE